MPTAGTARPQGIPQSGRLFVYGTLRQGFGRHGTLRRLNAKYVAEGSVPGDLFNLGEFPGAQKANQILAGTAGAGVRAERRVAGEVYQFQNISRAFEVLDRMEGFRSDDPTSGVFVREMTEVSLQNGNRLEAWIYWLRRSPWPASRIPSGNYAQV